MAEIDSFKLIALLSAVVTMVIRLWFHSQQKSDGPVQASSTFKDKALVFIAMLSMTVLPGLYIFTPLLSFADYHLPDLLAWMGLPVLVLTNYLLWKVHLDLGKNWSTRLEIQESHQLIQSGLYAYVRHPMYSSMLVGGIGQILLLQNWLAGPATLVSGILFCLLRIPDEEKLLVSYFKKDYLEYRSQTGAVFPKLKRPI